MTLELHFSAVRSNRLSLRFRSITDYLRGLFLRYECPIIGGVRVPIAYSTTQFIDTVWLDSLAVVLTAANKTNKQKNVSPFTSPLSSNCFVNRTLLFSHVYLCVLEDMVH